MTHTSRHAGRTLLAVTAALMLLLALTVSLSLIDLGPAGLAVAVVIAAAKAGVVLVWFMSLRISPRTYKFAAASGLSLLALLLCGTLADSSVRPPPCVGGAQAEAASHPSPQRGSSPAHPRVPPSSGGGSVDLRRENTPASR